MANDVTSEWLRDTEMFHTPYGNATLEPSSSKKQTSNDLTPGVNSDHPACPPSAPQLLSELPHTLSRGETSQKPHNGRSELPVYLPKCYTCPISGELMQEPVILVESAYTYEQRAIVEWLEQGNRHCPMTGIPLLHCSLIQNLALKNAISLWTRENGIPLKLPSSSESALGVHVPSGSGSDVEYDFVVALLEDQLKGMYKGWDAHDHSSRANLDGSTADDTMLEELSRLLSSSDRATHQSAALSLARACWGCTKAQTIVGNSKQSIEGTLSRLVTLLRAEIEEGRPGHMGWALAELLRYHTKNQMRLSRVRDVDILGMLVCMLKSNDDQWVARGARIVGAWVASNQSIQSLMLESGMIPLLVECLRGGSSIQKLHAGMALMHVSYHNRVTSMQILKDGALLAVPALLNSRALVVRVVGAGLITHLLGLFDYSWGTNVTIFRSLVDLMNQCEDYAGIVAASAIFELVHRDKIDLSRLTLLPVLPRVLELLMVCPYPGFRRGAHRFLIQWAKHVSISHTVRKSAGKACQETIKRLIQALGLHVTSISEIAIHVVWILLPMHQHYRLVMGALEKFERLSMDATLSENSRTMCREIVTYTRKTEMEHRTRVQVFFTTLGVCAVLKIIKLLK